MYSLQTEAVVQDLHTAAEMAALGRSLWDQYKTSRELKDLENAISYERRAADFTPESHPSKPTRLHDLGQSLLDRFEHVGEPYDLDSSILAHRRAVDLTPEKNPHMPILLNNLGSALQSRFKRFGRLDDLENAIITKRGAVELAPEGHPDLPVWLTNLGNALQSRSEYFEDLDDLQSAISAKRHAVELAPEGHPNVPVLLNNLGVSLHSRYKRLGDLDDLEQAISVERRAANRTPEGHPDEAKRLSNLGASFQSRFERSRDLVDLEGAVSAKRRAVELTPEGHFEMPSLLSNLGDSLLLRFEHLGEVGDLEGAISANRQAVELTPKDHPDMGIWLRNLGVSMQVCFTRDPSRENFRDMVQCFKDVTLQVNAKPSVRLKSAERWAMLELTYSQYGSTESRLQAHSSIIDALPEIVWLGNNLTRRYSESAQVANLVNDAVFTAIDVGDWMQAVEWLELGRGLIWSQVLSLRTPVDDLAQHYPEFSVIMEVLSEQIQLSHLSYSTSNAADGDYLSKGSTNYHRDLVIDYDLCLKDIRACPGFERFLRPQKLVSLVSSMKHIDGPVVFINVHSSRCDALALFPDANLKPIRLPDLTESRANRLQAFCARQLRESNVRERATVPRDNNQLANGFRRLLGHLWLWIVRPVLQALNYVNPDGHSRLPHVTWCLSGSLTQLPLHAAGRYPDGPHVYDFVVASYTPSLSALVRAQVDLEKRSSTPSILLVTQPATPGLPTLPGTTDEGHRVLQVLSELQIESVTFDGDQATVGSIQTAIGQHPWLHLACHGVQDPNDPTQSAFILHDGKLTLSTLMRTVSENAELAFLSACQTATGDEKVPEEAAHLAAGMLAVGFNGVVGTMWSIGDPDAPVVVEAYYKKLLELRRTGAISVGGTGAAYALHEAVKCLREITGMDNFVRWIPFVHYGV